MTTRLPVTYIHLVTKPSVNIIAPEPKAEGLYPIAHVQDSDDFLFLTLQRPCPAHFLIKNPYYN